MAAGERTTLETVFKATLLSIVVFAMIFAFYATEVQKADRPMTVGINDTYTNMTSQFNTINSSITNVRENIFALSESKGILDTAISTISGFTATIKLMKDSIDFGFNTLMIMLRGGSIPIPGFFSAFIFLMITIIIAFAILKAISGRENI